MDQATIFGDLATLDYQDHAYQAVHDYEEQPQTPRLTTSSYENFAVTRSPSGTRQPMALGRSGTPGQLPNSPDS